MSHLNDLKSTVPGTRQATAYSPISNFFLGSTVPGREQALTIQRKKEVQFLGENSYTPFLGRKKYSSWERNVIPIRHTFVAFSEYMNFNSKQMLSSNICTSILKLEFRYQICTSLPGYMPKSNSFVHRRSQNKIIFRPRHIQKVRGVALILAKRSSHKNLMAFVSFRSIG